MYLFHGLQAMVIASTNRPGVGDCNLVADLGVLQGDDYRGPFGTGLQPQH